MNFQKIVAATIVALTAVGATGLSGCSRGDSADGGTEELHILAAASLTHAFGDMVQEFGKDNPDMKIAPLVTGGSQTLVQQVNAGAPADVLALANEKSRELLVAPAVDTPATIFATNTLVIVTPKNNPAHIEGIADLARDGVTVAVCVEKAPCGRASKKLLATTGVTLSHPTEENNVAAVLVKAQMGEVDAALVYASDAHNNDKVRTIEVPEAKTIVNRYPISALTGNPAAKKFVEFVLSPKGRAILQQYGLGEP